MESDERLLSVRALEETVVTSSVASISALENTTVGLLPSRSLGRISLSVPLEQSDTVIWGPAVVC